MIYSFILLFGFRENKIFINDLKKLTKELIQSTLKILIIYNLIILLFYHVLPITESLVIYFLKSNIFFIAIWGAVNLSLFIIYNLSPHLISKSLIFSSNYLISRIIINDKKEPISGLFRYFNYLTAISSLIQFAIMWVWNYCA